MVDHYIILPIILQFITAIILLFFWTRKKAQKVISVIASFTLICVSSLIFHSVWVQGTKITHAGNWSAPFGITFVADMLGATMVLLTSMAGFAVSLFSTGSIRNTGVKFGYFPVLHFLLMGLNGAFLTGDIFNLYVWFEIIIIASFVLLVMDGEKGQIEGSLKYVTINLLASVVFLTAIAVLYGSTGSLNMADLSIKVGFAPNKGLINVIALLFFLGFGIKSAIFPLYFWLPASYHTPPSAVSAIFAGLLTKVGVYALVRVFTLIFIPDSFMMHLITGLGVMGIITGAAGAMVQFNIRKVLSYLIICHIGYMMVALGMYTEQSFSGLIFYLIHDIIIKTNLFLICGLIFMLKGSYSMNVLGSLYREYPKLSLIMAIALFSLIGIPPLSGFWAKLLWVRAGLIDNNYLPVIFVILGSFFTLIIISRLWAEVFWKNEKEVTEEHDGCYFESLAPLQRNAMIISICFLSLVSLFIGLGSENIIMVSGRISGELINYNHYVEAVLGELKHK